jgi:3-hydroxyacyl-[acyl-carrier-protein] dehydratase
MRFILIDTILELEPGKYIKASKRLSAHEEIFRDHFPGFPVVPGVLLIEMMSQAAGKCLDADGTHPGRAMMGKITSASFRAWVKPEEEIIIHATFSKNRPNYATADCFAEVGGKIVCSAKLFFVFTPREPDYQEEILNAYWRSNPHLQSRKAR